jgi:hypothetical protein
VIGADAGLVRFIIGENSSAEFGITRSLRLQILVVFGLHLGVSPVTGGAQIWFARSGTVCHSEVDFGVENLDIA